ncbi:MAG: hypothetical protein ACYSWX_03645 [Planctomycetota bacterium]
MPGLFLVDQWVGWLDRDTGSDENLWLEDEFLGWVPRPGYTEDEWGTSIDRFGLRNEEIPLDAEADELRILGLGASRIYGARNVLQSETWSYWLEALLERYGSVRVLNGGVQAYSVAQAARRGVLLLDEERDGVRVDPDLVFIALSPSAQMLIDNSDARRWVRVDGELVDASVVDGWPEPLVPLRVAFHRLAMRSNLYVRHRAKLQAGGGDRPEAIQRWFLSREPVPESVAPRVEDAFRALTELRDACRAREIELVALLIPTEAQDSNRRWNQFLRVSGKFGAPPIGTPRLESIEVLAERCQELGISAWDLSAACDQFATDRDNWYADDGIHWSGQGHQLIARALLRELTESGLLGRLLGG